MDNSTLNKVCFTKRDYAYFMYLILGLCLFIAYVLLIDDKGETFKNLNESLYRHHIKKDYKKYQKEHSSVSDFYYLHHLYN